MPPKKNPKKGEFVLNPGHVVALPRAHPDSVEVAHPASLPSFLVASSLFLIATHSKCTLEPFKEKQQQQKQDADESAAEVNTPRGGKRARTPTSASKQKRGTSTSPQAKTSSPKGKKGEENLIDVNSAVTPRSAPSWKLVVHKSSIFQCADLIGELGTSLAGDAFQHIVSFSAYSSAHHGYVLIRDDTGTQRIFAGGLNDEGQLPFGVSLDSSASPSSIKMPVASVKTVPFTELKGLQFRLASNSTGAASLIAIQVEIEQAKLQENTNQRKLQQQGGNHQGGGAEDGSQDSAVNTARTNVSMFSTASTASTSGAHSMAATISSIIKKTDPTCLKFEQGATIVGLACGSAHSVVLIKNPKQKKDSWIPTPSTFLFGCGRPSAIGNVCDDDDDRFSSRKEAKSALCELPDIKTPNSNKKNSNNNNNSSSSSTSTSYENNSFRHLVVGDGEDFDAVWAFDDCTYARGRRGLVVFGTILGGSGEAPSSSSSTPSRSPASSSSSSSSSSNKNNNNSSNNETNQKFHSPDRALVVIPAPLGCKVKEVISLNPVGNAHPRATYVFVDDNDNVTLPFASSSTSTSVRNFDGTRLLLIHTAFPSGSHGDLKMLHPPPPIFSYADVTEKIFGSAATILAKMGASTFKLKKLCCGSEHAVGITTDGAVLGFGSNHFGQLGETAGGSDRGALYADELAIGPRSARMYPSPDCSSVAPRLYKQYYDTAVLLRPPSLRRNQLVIAATAIESARSQQQSAKHVGGKTVEFSEVVSVVPIPAISDMLQASASGSLTSASSSSPLEDNNNNNTGNEENEDDYDDEQQGSGTFKGSSEKGGMGKRRNTGFPKGFSLQNASSSSGGAGAGGKFGGKKETGAAGGVGGIDTSVIDDVTAVMNPAWPATTVVDCCCGPLYTALMQADAELLFLGDHLPPVLSSSSAVSSRQESPTNF